MQGMQAAGRRFEAAGAAGRGKEEKTKGEEMSETNEVPELVTQFEMKRHWWIAYSWKEVTEVGDKEPRYARAGLRPISEAVSAAADFDIFLNAYWATRG